jgi:hypothetical protein
MGGLPIIFAIEMSTQFFFKKELIHSLLFTSLGSQSWEVNRRGVNCGEYSFSKYDTKKKKKKITCPSGHTKGEHLGGREFEQ